RGQGMFVASGALSQLRTQQRQQFLEQQIPQIAATLAQLDMSLDDFMQQLKQHIEDAA
nr:GntR family transcriptional regulator [Vibrio vulnificus]